MPSLRVGRGIGTSRRRGTSRRASRASTRALRNSRTLVDVTGIEPARGNTIATTPSRTTPETTARSVSDRPHGGSSTSITATATRPTGGTSHSAATDATEADASATR